MVRDVASRSPAHRLEFRPGDVVVEVNGAKIDSVAVLLAAVAEERPQWKIKVRRAGRLFSLSISG